MEIDSLGYLHTEEIPQTDLLNIIADKLVVVKGETARIAFLWRFRRVRLDMSV